MPASQAQPDSPLSALQPLAPKSQEPALTLPLPTPSFSSSSLLPRVLALEERHQQHAQQKAHQAMPRQSIVLSTFLKSVCYLRFPRLNKDGEWHVESTESIVWKATQHIASSSYHYFVDDLEESRPDSPLGLPIQQAYEQATEGFKVKFHDFREDLRFVASSQSLRSAAMLWHVEIVAVLFVFLCELGDSYEMAYATAVLVFLLATLQLVVNTGYLAEYVFQFFEHIQGELDDAIDRLQLEITLIVACIQPPTLGIGLALALGLAIEVAQRLITIEKYLPRVLQHRLYFRLAVGLPFFGLTSTCFLIKLMYVRYLQDTRASSAAGSVASRPDPAEQEGLWDRVFEPLVLILLIGALKSWPFVRFITNNLVSLAEHIANHLLRRHILSSPILRDVCWFMNAAGSTVMKATEMGVRATARGCDEAAKLATRSCVP